MGWCVGVYFVEVYIRYWMGGVGVCYYDVVIGLLG